jgi:23S rRNA pseudouridine1911/1915/1917 synthase
MPDFSVAAELPLNETMRLDKYIASLSDGITRSKLKSSVTKIILNNKHAKLSSKVKHGDCIVVSWEDLPIIFEPENISLNILYDDNSVTVLNKIQGMVTHPGLGNWHGTLVNALLYEWGREASVLPRPGIVHRLDKDTSGVIITAKTENASAWLSEQFFFHKVKKEYIAIVTGHPKSSHGHIKTRIIRDSKNRKRFKATEDTTERLHGKFAHTVYHCITCYGPFSLMRLRIKTGRTHQIRVHMKYIGCPVLGDPIYGSKSAVFPTATLMLHARLLAIRLPDNDELSSFTAPVPERMKAVLRELHARYKKCVLP